MLNRLTIALCISAAALVGGCATSTSLDAQWVNPEFAGKRPVRSVMVVGAVRDTAMRRIYEDRMVAALGALGIKAVPAYAYFNEEGPINEEQLRRGIAGAGVAYAMVTRIINVSTQVNVSPGMVMGPAWGPGCCWGGGWGPGWGGFAGYYNTTWAIPPQVTTTQNVHADTRVFEARNATVVWSAATTTSTGYNSAQQLFDQFVQLIVSTMTKDGIV